MDWKALPSLNALKAFAAVAETGNYTKAGSALNVSHAAVNQQVKTLEERLGVPLVVREGRGIRLTAEGMAYEGVSEGAATVGSSQGTRQAGPGWDPGSRGGAPMGVLALQPVRPGLPAGVRGITL